MGLKELKHLSRLVRGDVVRMTSPYRSACLPRALSSVDLLVTLYWSVMHIDVTHPLAVGRDRLVVADDSIIAAYYATLARRGFFLRQNLWCWGQLGSVLQRIPDDRHTLGVDGPGGIPDLGLALASGMALGYSQGSERVFCLVGHKALSSSVFWQTAAAIGQGVLVAPELLLLIDDGTEWQGERLTSLGWALENLDGHDFLSMEKELRRKTEGKPTARVFRCRLGCGVSFLEERTVPDNLRLSQLERERALAEIDGEPTEPEEEMPWTF